jgi:hypothetical protein
VAEHLGARPLSPSVAAFYVDVLQRVDEAGIESLIGGAYAFEMHTGREGHTRDLDLFVRPADAPRVLEAMHRAGYGSQLAFSHWLGKIHFGEAYVDVIFSSGNGIGTVDDSWFAHAVPATVLGRAVRLCAPEEMIWQKAFIMERERYDGADVAHLVSAADGRLDWDRLLARFGEHSDVLLAHLILIRYVYPSEAQLVPDAVLDDLLDRSRRRPPIAERICRGTLLSRAQYLVDVERDGFRDARLPPEGPMSRPQVADWTEPVRAEEP